MPASYTPPISLKGRAFTIIGAGTLGRRIALMWLTQGGTVHLFDSNAAQTQDANEYIQGALPAVLRDIVHSPKRGDLKLYNNREEALKSSWIVVECVPEVLDLKINLLGELDSILPPDVILATNSSSYTASEVNAKVIHKDRLISMHYYMPPGSLPVEVMPTQFTHPSIAPLLIEQAALHGLKPYLVRKESVGLIANRIWAAIKRECLYTASQGIASPAEIDALLKDALGFPIPPFQSMDNVGLDVVLDIERHYQKTRPGQCPPEAAEYVESFVKQGKLGTKSGQGFYSHPKEAPHADKDQVIYLDIIKSEINSITVDGSEEKTLISGLPHNLPDGLQFDSRPGKSQLYWTAMGLGGGQTNDGSLWRANLDGSNVTRIVEEGKTHTPKQLYLDMVAEKLYWCDREGGRIQRCSLDGSNLETVYDSSPGMPRPLTDSTRWCVGITLDTKRGLLYWTQKGGSKGWAGRIFRAGIDIPGGSTAETRQDIQVLAHGLPEPIDLELDDHTQMLYWTDRGDPPFGNTLNHLDVSSDLSPETKPIGPSASLMLSDHYHETIGLALDTENHLAYVSDLLGSLWVCDLGTGVRKALIQDRGHYSGLVLIKHRT